jgi:protein TonB
MIKGFFNSELFRWIVSALFALTFPILFILLFTMFEKKADISEAPFIALDYIVLPATTKSAPPPKAITKPEPPPEKEKPPEEVIPEARPDEAVYAPTTKPSPPVAQQTAVKESSEPIDNTGEVMDVNRLDNTDFAPIFNPAPTYPAIAREAGLEGFVLVELVIDAKGFVKTFSIRKTVGHQAFAIETSKVIRKWRFPPPRIQGQAMEIRYEYKVVFRLD